MATSYDVTVITTDPIAQDDIIRAMMFDDTYPTYETTKLPSGTLYRIHAQMRDVSRTRMTVAKNLETITLYVCDPV